jgi:hypothetical protein
MLRWWRLIVAVTLALVLWGPPAARAAAPAIAFQPGEADFGEWPAKSEQRPLLTITLRNSGDAPLHLDHFAAPTGFELWNPPERPCQGYTGAAAAALPPGETCAFGVAFVPAIGDAYLGALQVYSDAPGSPHALPLHGIGLPSVLAPAERRCFDATGYCVGVRFLAYWDAHGGLARNGYPISDALLERLEDGQIYVVQYFERVRLEYHPEHPPATEVLLGQLGRRVLTGVTSAPTAITPAMAGYTYFAETGHNVGPRFGAYWQANGGLAQFGYPLTELFEERLEDGKTYQVQYFERARFELHPENAGTPYEILLGQFGRRVLAASTPH